MWRLNSIILASFAIIFAGSIGFASALSNGDNAILVVGQPDFTSSSGSVTVNSFSSPWGIDFDSSENLWVVDLVGSRVLKFPTPSSNQPDATIVLGQKNFTSNTSNGHGSQDSALANPFGIAIDSSDNVWIADINNNRLVRFDAPFTNGQAASIALGQTDLNGISSGLTATLTGRPYAVAIDSSGNVWMADNTNHRVLRFDAPITTGKASTLVLGQKNFTAGGANGHGSQNSALNQPEGLNFDNSGNLWVSDAGNNRVLRFDAPFSNGQAASLVLGQPDLITTSAGTSEIKTNSPRSVVVDSSGSVWVEDNSNNRVIRFDAPITTGKAATLVIGQNDFTSSSANKGGSVDAGGLSNPSEIVFDSEGNLWVADSNNRVLKFLGGDVALVKIVLDRLNALGSGGEDNDAPTLGKSSTGQQVVENGFSYQSNLGGFAELDADLGLTHMDSLKVAVGGMPDAPPGEIRDDARDKLNERGLGDVAKTFDNISDALDALDNFINRPLPDVPPDQAPPEPQDISDVLNNLKQGLDQSHVDPESHPNPEQAAQINNLLDRIAQKIAEIEDAI